MCYNVAAITFPIEDDLKMIGNDHVWLPSYFPFTHYSTWLPLFILCGWCCCGGREGFDDSRS